MINSHWLNDKCDLHVDVHLWEDLLNSVKNYIIKWQIKSSIGTNHSISVEIEKQKHVNRLAIGAWIIVVHSNTHATAAIFDSSNFKVLPPKYYKKTIRILWCLLMKSRFGSIARIQKEKKILFKNNRAHKTINSTFTLPMRMLNVLRCYCALSKNGKSPKDCC